MVGLPTSDNFIQSCKRSCFCFGISLFQVFRPWGWRKAMKRLEQATLESFSFINKYSQPRSQGAFSCREEVVRDGPLEKLLGGGGGNFRAAGIFYQIPCMNFFYFFSWKFFRIICVHEFFLERIFFCTSFAPNPPHKFSNGLSLNIPGLTFSHFVIYTIY